MSKEFDFDLVDSGAQDPVQFSAPIIWWKHGKSELEEAGGINHTGGFFFTYDQAGEGTQIEGWKESWFKGSDGSKVYGLATAKARLVIIRSRRRWFKEDGNRTLYRAWNDYAEGFRGQMQAIGFVQGYDAPVCFSFKGNIISYVESCIRYHVSKVVSVANQSAPEGKKLPYYALWMPILSGKHFEAGKGNQTHEVTMPELWTPKVIDRAYALQAYIGKDLLLRAQSLYRDLDDWVRQWERFSTDAEMPLGAADKAFEDDVKAVFREDRQPAHFAGNVADESEIPF